MEVSGTDGEDGGKTAAVPIERYGATDTRLQPAPRLSDLRK